MLNIWKKIWKIQAYWFFHKKLFYIKIHFFCSISLYLYADVFPCPLRNIHVARLESRLIDHCRTTSLPTWSPSGHRLSAVRDRAWAVNQNRNARWADSEERLFGLTLDLGQEARLTLAEGKTGNSTANRISLFFFSFSLSLSPFSLSFSSSSFVWQPGLGPTIMFGHSFSRHALEAPYSTSDLSVGRCLIVY